jgi:hypothetical protein
MRDTLFWIGWAVAFFIGLFIGYYNGKDEILD